VWLQFHTHRKSVLHMHLLWCTAACLSGTNIKTDSTMVLLRIMLFFSSPEPAASNKSYGSLCCGHLQGRRRSRSAAAAAAAARLAHSSAAAAARFAAAAAAAAGLPQVQLPAAAVSV